MNAECECIERCYICLENLDNVSGNLKCGCFNRYHTNCLETWLLIQNECPTCKKKINEIKNDNHDEEEEGRDNDDEDFELELDDNDIFYNPLAYFISIYIIYFIVLFSINHFIYSFFMKMN
jgi:hypothetical protein